MSNLKTHPQLGDIIERLILERGMSKAEFGRRISTSRQNVSIILKRQAMDSALLWRIGLVLETNLFQLLAEAFNEGTPIAESQLRTGKLEIRLEISDVKLARATTELVKGLVADYRTADIELATRSKPAGD